MEIWKRVCDAFDSGAVSVAASFDWLGGRFGGIAAAINRAYERIERELRG